MKRKMKDKRRIEKEKKYFQHLSLLPKFSEYFEKDEKPMYKFIIERANSFLSSIKGRKNVLEVGCGSGSITRNIDVSDDGSIIGIDISENMLEKARRITFSKGGKKNLKFMIADAYNLPFEKEYFDLVLIPRVLDIVMSPSTVLQEAQRVLKKNGVIIISIDCYKERSESCSFSMSRFLLKFYNWVGYIPVYNWMSKVDVRELLEKENLVVKDEQKIFQDPVVLYFMCEKKK